MTTRQILRMGTFGLLMISSLSTVAKGQTPATPESSPPYNMVEFPSEDAVLRGRLYLPQSASERSPIVVMAHGYSATINGMVADRYAEQIVKAGFAVLLYDHRNFGISGGEPRQEINVWTQARGYRDAISFVSERPEIDPHRIALWGDSMSGAEVIVAAAVDHRVKAIIAQIPGCGDDLPPEDPDGKQFASIRETLVHGDIEGTPETTVGPLPVVSFSPEIYPSMMKPMTAFRWFIEYGGRFDTKWLNWVTHVTPNVPVSFSPGLCVEHIKAPILMVVAYEDEMPYVSSDVARHVYEMAPEPKQLLQIEGGHFGLLHYPSPFFDEASQAQVDFLKEHLN